MQRNSEKPDERLDSDYPRDRDRGTTILCVDNDPIFHRTTRHLLEKAFPDDGLHLLFAFNADEAFDLLAKNRVHVVLLDYDLAADSEHSMQGAHGNPNDDGLNLIEPMLKIQDHLQIIMVTGNGSIETAMKAVDLGAMWYIEKHTGKETLPRALTRAIRNAKSRIAESQILLSSPSDSIPKVVGISKHSKYLKDRVQLYAKTDAPVLILGEPGVGKTVIAKLINLERKRFNKDNNRPFLAINLATMTAGMIDRELFGTERGAYTGASEVRKGYFEAADGGTLYLDEVGELDITLQGKLLQVLDEGFLHRLGGTAAVQVRVKIVSSTNRDLEAMVEEKTFREDLFSRLSSHMIRVAPLRDRREDIPEVIREALPSICNQYGTFVTFEELPADLIERLCLGPLRGNIRTLRSAIGNLLSHAPRNRAQRPDLSRWREVEELNPAPTQRASRSQNDPITDRELFDRGLDVIGKGFEFHGFLENVRLAVCLNAQRLIQGKVNNRETAKILGIGESICGAMTRALKARANTTPPKHSSKRRKDSGVSPSI